MWNKEGKKTQRLKRTRGGTNTEDVMRKEQRRLRCTQIKSKTKESDLIGAESLRARQRNQRKHKTGVKYSKKIKT